MDRQRLWLVGGLTLCVIGLVGCGAGHDYFGYTPTAEFSREVQLDASLTEGKSFSATTLNGAIEVTGAEVSTCTLKAAIKVKAGMTDDVAKAVAEQVIVELVETADGLVAKIDTPTLKPRESISINLNVTLPRQTDLDLTTHNGRIMLEGLKGTIDATTHNGRVMSKDVEGKATLVTHNGRIGCTDFSGDAHLRTHNGAVEFHCADSAPAGRIDIETYNGRVVFDAPAEYSATVDLATHNGSIHTNLPILTVGELSKQRRTGAIGEGEGTLRIVTHNGSIRINK